MEEISAMPVLRNSADRAIKTEHGASAASFCEMLLGNGPGNPGPDLAIAEKAWQRLIR